MPKGKGVHTVPAPKGAGWINMLNGKVAGAYKQKAAAVAAGRLLAKEEKTEHVIHDAKGKIAEKNSYGKDSPKRKG
jgi:hypothetical protein